MKRKPEPTRGPGRPVVSDLDRKLSRSITLPASLWESLSTAAESRGLTLSAHLQSKLTK